MNAAAAKLHTAQYAATDKKGPAAAPGTRENPRDHVVWAPEETHPTQYIVVRGKPQLVVTPSNYTSLYSEGV